MSDELRIQDLAIDEIAELLNDDGSHLSIEQARALREFIAGIGGIDNAVAAIEMLRDMERAA